MSKHKLITTMGTELISDNPLLHLRNTLIKWWSLNYQINSLQQLFDNDKIKITESQQNRLSYLLENFALDIKTNDYINDDVEEIGLLLTNKLFNKVLNPTVKNNVTVYIPGISTLKDLKLNSYITCFTIKPTSKSFTAISVTGNIKLISIPNNLIGDSDNLFMVCTNDLINTDFEIERINVIDPKERTFEFDDDNKYYHFLFIKYWGSEGYMYYDNMIKNNTRQFNGDKLNWDLDKFALAVDQDDIIDLCSDIGQNLTEKRFTEILTANSEPNSESKYFIKNIDINNNIENLKQNRWMSFTIADEILIDNIRFGTEVLIFNSKSINYVDTLNIADKNEVLINSNEILPLISSKSYGYINPKDFPDLDDVEVIYIFSNFITYLRNDVDQSGDIPEFCKKLNIDNNKNSIEKFVTKHIPLSIIY